MSETTEKYKDESEQLAVALFRVETLGQIEKCLTEENASLITTIESLQMDNSKLVQDTSDMMDCKNDLIESQRKKIKIIKTAKERLLGYTRNCRKERDDWQTRAIRAEQHIESLQQRISVRDRLIKVQVGHIDTINLALESQNEEIEKLKSAIDQAAKELPYGNSAYKILLKSLYPESFKEQETELSHASYGDFLQSRGRRIP